MGLRAKSIRLSTGLGENPAAKFRVPPAPPHKYPQAAFFAVDILLGGDRPRLDVNGLPDVNLPDISLRLEFYLTDLGAGIYFAPNVIVSLSKAVSVAGISVRGVIEGKIKDGTTERLSRNRAPRRRVLPGARTRATCRKSITSSC